MDQQETHPDQDAERSRLEESRLGEAQVGCDRAAKNAGQQDRAENSRLRYEKNDNSGQLNHAHQLFGGPAVPEALYDGGRVVL